MNWKIRFENKPSPLPAIFQQEQNGDVRPLDPLGPAVQIEGYSGLYPENNSINQLIYSYFDQSIKHLNK